MSFHSSALYFDFCSKQLKSLLHNFKTQFQVRILKLLFCFHSQAQRIQINQASLICLKAFLKIYLNFQVPLQILNTPPPLLFLHTQFFLLLIHIFHTLPTHHQMQFHQSLLTLFFKVVKNPLLSVTSF